MSKAASTLEKPVTEEVNDARSRLKRLVEEEKKLVKGRFRCYETPGSSTRIQVKKYKELPMFDKTMFDGGEYEVPLYVARHLNGIDACARDLDGKIGSCSYPIHAFTWGPNGPTQPADGTDSTKTNTTIARRVRRYGFESLEFGAVN